MEFPRGLAAGAPEVFLGERAVRLETRARPGARGDREAGAELLFVPEALEPALLERLRTRWQAEAAPAEGGLARVRVVPARLAGLEGDHPSLACLAAALRAVLAPPPRPIVLGILNVTPDSFSDGGRYLAQERAIEHGRELRAAGADWIDVGGESTRPGAAAVPLELELERILPVVRALAREGVVSIDTTKAAVARAALEAGATVVNDVSAGRNDARMLPLVAEHRAGLVLMHARGTPRDMQADPRYGDVVRTVAAHLRERARAARDAGVDPARIALDPGFGFGKTVEHNRALLAALPELRALGFPLCVGLSRKSFLGRLSGCAEADQRGAETVAATALAAAAGAALHRVHEPGPIRRALAIASALAADTGSLPPEPPCATSSGASRS
jgi:dihydropteroate synthase